MDNVNIIAEDEAWARAERLEQWMGDQGIKDRGYEVERVLCYLSNVDHLTREVESLARKAKKLGMLPPFVNRVNGNFTVERTFNVPGIDGEPGGEVKRKVLACFFLVMAPQIKIEGWDLVAVVDHLGGSGTGDHDFVIRELPGNTATPTVQKWLKQFGPRCTHCGMVRSRNTTYVLANGDRFEVVGSSCLKDFCGIDPAVVALRAGVAKLGEVGGVLGERYEESVADFLPWVALAVRTQCGGRYIGKQEAERLSWERYNSGRHNYGESQVWTTMQEVNALQNAWAMRAINPEYRTAVEPTDEDKAQAEAVRRYVLTLDPTQSTYNQNLVALVKSDVLLHNHRGLVASAFSGYLREQRTLAEAKIRASRPSSEYVGTIGQTGLTLEAEVIFTKQIEGNYGTSTLISFVTDKGEVGKWFASGVWDLEKGERITIRGSVKDHQEYRGEKQTVLTRCKITHRTPAASSPTR